MEVLLAAPARRSREAACSRPEEENVVADENRMCIYVNDELRTRLAAVSIQDFGGPQDTRSMLERRHTNRHIVVQPLPLLCWPKRRVKSYIIDTLLALLTG